MAMRGLILLFLLPLKGKGRVRGSLSSRPVQEYKKLIGDWTTCRKSSQKFKKVFKASRNRFVSSL
jgi:hypothetical protein